jgi:hypothetical protein
VTSVRLQAEAEFLPFATQLLHILTGRKEAGDKSNTFVSILLSPNIFHGFILKHRDKFTLYLLPC